MTYDFGVYNCVFDDSDGLISDLYLGLDSTASDVVIVEKCEFINCTIISSIPFVKILANAGESPSTAYVIRNCVTAYSTFYSSNMPTIETSLTDVSLDANYNITSAGWIDTGTGTDPDETQADIGVYGGCLLYTSPSPRDRS